MKLSILEINEESIDSKIKVLFSVDIALVGVHPCPFHLIPMTLDLPSLSKPFKPAFDIRFVAKSCLDGHVPEPLPLDPCRER